MENENAELRARIALIHESSLEEMSRIIQNQEEKIRELETQIERDRTRVEIGNLILQLSSSKAYRGTKMGKRLYGLACAQIPAASMKYLQMFIPLVIAAFLFDIGVARFFDNLDFVPDLTPSDKVLSDCVLLLNEHVLYKISTYMNKGAKA